MNAPVATSSLTPGTPNVVCRPIEDGDFDALLDLLVEGFPSRRRSWWARGLARMATRPVVEGCEKYGYVLDAGGALVGCLLVIFAERTENGVTFIRGNVSSWYARPAFRVQASRLVAAAFRHPDVTFLNITPAPHTIPILEAQRYQRYIDGHFVTVPFALTGAASTRVTPIAADYTGPLDAVVPELDLLRRHAGWDCKSLVCSDGETYEPFVFRRRRVLRTTVPAAELIYCRDVDAVVRFAGAIGRHLLTFGILCIAIDANGPIEGLRGLYRRGSGLRFFRGPHRPRAGDLADTELVIFGT